MRGHFSDIKGLGKSLDKLYMTYDFRGRVAHDPIQIPMRYKDGRDVEAAGFIASCMAYGRVALFLPVIDKILGEMGSSPYEFISEFNARKQARLFAGIKYRFNETEDIVALIHVMNRIYNKYGSLEAAFLNYYKDNDPGIGAALAGMVGEIMSLDTTPVYGADLRPHGFKFFFPSPGAGSACKRGNLFLRWMARKADIDLGVWKKVPPHKLIIPLDTHIARVSRCLGFTKRKTNDWRTAVEITEALKSFDPVDPLKYDFALCHRGISGVCAEAGCGSCELEMFRVNA